MKQKRQRKNDCIVNFRIDCNASKGNKRMPRNVIVHILILIHDWMPFCPIIINDIVNFNANDAQIACLARESGSRLAGFCSYLKAILSGKKLP